MLVNLVQPLKARSPIEVTLSGIVMLVKLVQPPKPLIEVTLFGIIMLVRLVQPLKVSYSIEVILFGISMLVRLVHP